jgi:flagellum-specific peptidoglycan hydrolase FlgJ
MKVIPKLQQGNTIESDNTKVVRPEIHEPIKAKPRQYSIVDLGGEPSNDTRSAAERNRDYWHPIKGAKARFRASMSNETNPLVGIERTILPSAAGAALVTTPAAVVGGALGNMTVDKLTGGWGNWLEDKTGIPSEIGIYTNPGAWYGGAKGYKIGKDKLITKSIKGDADLAWNPINKNHWIFNKEARTPSNIAMATANRITPFLSKVEKLPLKVAAYKAAKRTNGNASVSLQDIKTMPADYTGSSILGGGNLEGRNLLAKYIFDENPVVKRMFFNKATSNIKPISRNEARRGFSHGDRYEQLYPGVHNRRYEMSAVVPSGRPLKFENVTKFTDYAGKNPISKVVGKETEPVMRMGDKEFMTFRQPGTDYIGPIDDVAGHLVKFQMNKGKLRQTSQDMWKFNPADYAKRWNDSPNTANQVRLIKQAALMDKVGRPFILQQSNPIWIEGKSVRNPELVTMAHGGRFDFKKSPLLKKQEEINGKRDMRKKFIKSSRPTYKKRIKKAQQGMRFASYNVVETPRVDITDITNPINPFSEYNYNTTYDKPTALVVPAREEVTPVKLETPEIFPKQTPADNDKFDVIPAKSIVKSIPLQTWKSPYTNRKQWATELINAYKKAGITNDNAIRMLLAQDALESSWGRSAQGKYNFGNLTTGSSWKGDYVTGNDKNAKGEAIKQKFRSYNSMDEYAADKIQFLKRLYDFDENDDINKFVAKLTGSNKGKRRYAEATNYAKVLTGVYNGIPKGENGMIIKYQNPAQPIKYMGGYDKRGNMVLPVTNENGMNNVTLPEVTVTPRNINLAGAVDRGRREAAPYVSTLLTGAIFGPLSVAGGYAGNEAVNKITNVASNDKYKDWADMLSKTTGMNPVVADFFNIGNLAGGFGMRNFGPKLKPVKDMAVGGNKWARARVISKAIDEAVNKGNPKVKSINNEIGRIRANNIPDGTYEFKDNNFKLPDYVTPNSPADPIELHATRLANGGFDRLPETVNGQRYFNAGNYNWAYKSNSMYPKIHYYDKAPLETIGKVSDDFINASTNKLPTGESYMKSRGLLNDNMIFATSSTGNIYVGRSGLSRVASDFGDNNIRRTVSHEMDHAIHIPGEAPKGFDTSLTDLSGYFSARNGTELTGRGTQIKDYYGLSSPDQEITEDMLRYAAKNYIKDTGMDNNMTEFFKSIVDWKEAAKWLSKWSTIIGTPVTISKMNKYDNSRILDGRNQ